MTRVKAWTAPREGGQPSLRAFVVLTGMVCTLILGTFTLTNALQVYRHTPESLAWCSLVNLKQQAALEKGAQKILLIGGSGVSLGLNAAFLEKELERPVANFGLQASLGIEIILTEAKKVLEPGDTALLIFEYPLFHLQETTSVAQEWLLGCGLPSLKEKSLPEQFLFFLGVNPMRWLDVLGQEEASYPEVHREMKSRFDRNGDRILDRHTWPDTSDRMQERLQLYQPENIHLIEDAPGPAYIKEFVDWAAAQDISVLASWPNTISFDEYQDDPRFQKIEGFYNDIDVTVIGKPELALLDVKWFYDTQYHLTAEGILKRTAAFNDALKNLPDAKDIIR